MEITAKFILEMQNLETTMALFCAAYSTDKSIFTYELQHNLQTLCKRIAIFEKLWSRNVASETTFLKCLDHSNGIPSNYEDRSLELIQEFPGFSQEILMKLKRIHELNEYVLIVNFENLYQCVVCLKNSLSEHDLFGHSKSRQHIKNIEKHIDSLKLYIKYWESNKTYYINKYITCIESPDEIYCRACNIKLNVKDGIIHEHFLSQEHKCTLIFKRLVESIASWNKSLNKNICEEPLNLDKLFRYIASTKKNETGTPENITQVEIKRAPELEQKYPGIPQVILLKLRSLHELNEYAFIINFKSLYQCVVCVTNSLNELDLFAHSKGKTHIKNMEIYNNALKFYVEFWENNKTYYVNKYVTSAESIDEIYCWACHVILSVKDDRKHFLSQEHKSSKAYKSLMESIDRWNKTLHKNICDEPVNVDISSNFLASTGTIKSSPENITHFERGIETKQVYPSISQTMLKKLRKLLILNELAIIINFDNIYQCVVCCKKTLRTPDLLSHTQSYVHIQETKKLENALKFYVKYWESHKTYYINKYITCIKSENKIYCWACNIALAVKVDVIHEHFLTKQHKCSKIYKELLHSFENWIKALPNSLCNDELNLDKPVPKTDKSEAISQLSTKFKSLEITEAAQEYPSIRPDILTKLRRLSIYNEFAIYKNFSNLYQCAVCLKKSLDEYTLFTHSKGSEHKKSMQEYRQPLKFYVQYWQSNKLHYVNKYITCVESVEEIYCWACNTVLRVKKGIIHEHFLSEQHKATPIYKTLVQNMNNWNKLNKNCNKPCK